MSELIDIPSLTPDQYGLLDDLLEHREYQLESALNEKPLPYSGNIAHDMEEQRARQEELNLVQSTREALVINYNSDSLEGRVHAQIDDAE